MSFKSDSYEHGGEAFSLQYGSGQLLGIAGKDTLQVSAPQNGCQPPDQLFAGHFSCLALENLPWSRQGQGEVPPS